MNRILPALLKNLALRDFQRFSIKLALIEEQELHRDIKAHKRVAEELLSLVNDQKIFEPFLHIDLNALSRYLRFPSEESTMSLDQVHRWLILNISTLKIELQEFINSNEEGRTLVIREDNNPFAIENINNQTTYLIYTFFEQKVEPKHLLEVFNQTFLQLETDDPTYLEFLRDRKNTLEERVRELEMTPPTEGRFIEGTEFSMS